MFVRQRKAFFAVIHGCDLIGGGRNIYRPGNSRRAQHDVRDGTTVACADFNSGTFPFGETCGFNGDFVFAGLPYTGDYIIGVSLAGAQPSYQGGVKAGRDVEYKIEMIMPGDGKRLTLEEISSLMQLA